VERISNKNLEGEKDDRLCCLPRRGRRTARKLNGYTWRAIGEKAILLPQNSLKILGKRTAGGMRFSNRHGPGGKSHEKKEQNLKEMRKKAVTKKEGGRALHPRVSPEPQGKGRVVDIQWGGLP